MSDMHSFDTDVACEVGVNAAVLYQNIKHWVAKNEANNKHFYEDCYWTYNSITAFDKLFSYLSKRQIRTALEKLIDKKYIGKGNFNQTPYDRTLWYCVLRKDHLPKKANREDGNGEPIPDSKPDSKPDTKNIEKDLFLEEQDTVSPSALKQVNDKISFDRVLNHWKEKLPPSKRGGMSQPNLFKLFCKQITKEHNSKQIADALIYMTTLHEFSKDNYQYMRALFRIIRNQDYEPYLGKVLDLRTQREKDKEMEYQGWARLARKGLERSIGRQPAAIPVEARKYFDEKDRKRFGWE